MDSMANKLQRLGKLADELGVSDSDEEFGTAFIIAVLSEMATDEQWDAAISKMGQVEEVGA